MYHVKSTAITSVTATVGTPGKATIKATVTIQDITDPGKPTTVTTSGVLTLTTTDKGEPGANDTVGINIMANSQLWFSSNGNPTIEQQIGGGNIQVR